MAYNLNSWGDLLVSGFAFAVANPALIVLHSKKNFSVDGKNYVSKTGRELANVCRIYVNVNSDNNTICCGSEWGYGAMGSKGVIIVCCFNFALSRSWQGGCWHPENINTGKTEKYRGFSFVFSRVYTTFASKN